MSNKMTGGEAIVQSLLRHGVDTVFGIPGVQTYALFDALHQASSQIKVVGSRHEQATAYMAMGYAKSTGKTGVFSVVPGPGVLNASAAICTAYGVSAPILCVTGEVPSDFIGSGKGHLHELPDQLATLRTLTKWAARIDHPGEAPALVAEAFHQMSSGRPRPVALEMPWDVFGSSAAVELVDPATHHTQIQADSDLLEKAAALLKGARNPMIMVGSGAQHASAEVLALAEHIQAPVVSWRGGKGIVADDHYLGFNCADGFKRWAQTDVLIGIGSRLELQWFRWPNQSPDLQIINIDIDPMQMTRIKPTIGIVGDAGTSSHDLLEILQRGGTRHASRREEFELLKAATQQEISGIQPHIDYLRVIRKVLPRDGFFVEEICQAGFTALYGFPVYVPRGFVTAGHQGTLGFGYSTSLGVKVGNPDRAVISISGDGGFMFGVQELATAIQHGINVISIVFNNNAFGNVMRDQQQRFNGHVIGSELVNPDFVKLAESFGMAGYRVNSAPGLQKVLEKALAADAPVLIEVQVDRNTEVSPWRFLMPPANPR